MLILEKSKYLSFIYQSNFTGYDKKLLYKIVYYKKIYKFESTHFFIRCIFFFLIKKNTIENLKFKFLTIICGIQKKRRNAKLFTSIRSTNFV